jgi:hypothetical protein
MMMRIAVVTVSLFGLAAQTAAADIGFKPIKDTGTWNDPRRFRLVDNDIEITLGDKAANVTACFLFVSENQLRQWDKGTLVWTWPLPSDYPRPTQFKVSTAASFASSSVEAARAHRLDPCNVVNNARTITAPRLESFDQLGIHQWYVFDSEFLMHTPYPLLVVRTVVSYSQPYRWTPQGLGELAYVLRTGSLWAGTIDRLTLRLRSTPGVELASCSWSLQHGKRELSDVEPDRDLFLTVRPLSTTPRK